MQVKLEYMKSTEVLFWKPNWIIYQARLRTNYSSLNQHLLSKHIVDIPLYTCGAIENTQHFIFICNSYNDLRRELIVPLSDLVSPIGYVAHTSYR